MSFEKLGLIEPVLKALISEGYSTPTPIQEKGIPVVLKGNDLIGCAQTGTGKTAAFAIPVLQLIYRQKKYGKPKDIKCLILTPTRELAVQIGESFAAYGKFTGLHHTVVYGGVNQFSQVKELKRGTDILIATPGRLLDLINQGFISLKQVQIFVLDEADRMLDMGFITDVKKISALLPPKKQTLFFSATMPAEIVELSENILKNPVRIEVAPTFSTADAIDQAVYFVNKKDKNALLSYILEKESVKSALVFTRTKRGADKVVKYLTSTGIRAEAIHGNKSQSARQNALRNFKNRKIRLLVATDIASRGIDIDELSHVINFELPNVPETYVHRIGRTGRAGLSGTAISFCDNDEKSYLSNISKLISMKIPSVLEHPFISDVIIPKKNETEIRNKIKPQIFKRTYHDTSKMYRGNQ